MVSENQQIEVGGGDVANNVELELHPNCNPKSNWWLFYEEYEGIWNDMNYTIDQGQSIYSQPGADSPLWLQIGPKHYAVGSKSTNHEYWWALMGGSRCDRGNIQTLCIISVAAFWQAKSLLYFRRSYIHLHPSSNRQLTHMPHYTLQLDIDRPVG
jgi:hypothetical protein